MPDENEEGGEIIVKCPRCDAPITVDDANYRNACGDDGEECYELTVSCPNGHEFNGGDWCWIEGKEQLIDAIIGALEE